MTFDPYRVSDEYGELLSELEELVDYWRGGNDSGVQACADDLEQVIQKYD